MDLEICSIELDFPKWFFVRKETIDIIKVFEEQMKEDKKIVFKGTPGVGKSMLVVVFAFYLALIQGKRVLLFRRERGKQYSLLYLDVQKRIFWRVHHTKYQDLKLYEEYLNDAELCLDGFEEDEIRSYEGLLGLFRLLATSVQYKLRSGEGHLYSECLVPFWSLSDMNAFGERFGWLEQEIKEKYFYSGGNLRDFTAPREEIYTYVRKSINKVVRMVDFDVATLFSTQYWFNSTRQIDRLRMTGVKASTQSNLSVNLLKTYHDYDNWICVITSEYASRQLGKIVETSYYEELYSICCMLGDCNGLKLP